MATALQIQQLYVAYFGRPADPAGLDYWVSTGISTKDFAAAMYAQPEFQQVNANLPVIDQVNALYLNLFGRSGDTEGLLYWTQQINSGKLTLASIANDLIFAANNNTSAQSKLDLTALNNKTATAIAYTGDVRETSASLIAYNATSTTPWVTGPQFTSAVNYLATVTQTAPTAAAIQASVDAMTVIATPGQTFTLTTSIETVPAAGAIAMPAGSTVSGILAADAAAGQTFQTGDTINANATSDVNITVLANRANTVSINNARSVNFRNLAGVDSTAADNNAILWNNVGTFSSTASGAGLVGVSNGALATTYALVNPLIDSSAGLNVTYRGADIIGATDTAKFSVTGVGSSSSSTDRSAALTINTNSTGATSTGVETVAIATAGTNSVNMNFGTNTSRVNVTGAGANTLNMQAGGIVATAQFYDLTGATGANTLDVAATLATSSTVTGGTGSDILYVTPAGVALTNLSVSAFETLRLRNAAANGILGFTGAPAFSTIRMGAGGNQGTVVTLLNGLSSTQALAYRGAESAATIANEQVFNGLTGTGALTGAADTLNIAFSNGGRALTGNSAYRAGVITALGVETVAVSTADSATTGVTLLDGIASNTMSSFTATGTGVLTVTNLNGTNATTLGSLSTINLSGLASTAAVSTITVADNSLAAASTFTASAGGGGLILAAETATDTLIFNGGAGADVIAAANASTSLFTGFVTFNGGAGADVIFLTNSAGVTANGGDGNDNLIGSGAIDTIRGDAGNDTIIGAAGADVLTGGAGNDVFSYLLSNQGVDTISDFAVADDRLGIADAIINPAGTANNANYAAGDFVARATIQNIVVADTLKAILITTAQTTTEIAATVATGGATDAFAVVFNSTLGFAQVVYDTDWRDAANRVTLTNLTNLTSAASIAGITQTNFLNLA